MNSIVSALHSRYTLGLILHNVDNEWHEIRIRLSKAALRKHRAVRVDYSTGYLAAGSFSTVLPSVTIPEITSRIRVAVCDVATGKVAVRTFR